MIRQKKSLRRRLRRPFTLLEVIIAMSLLAVIMTLLGYSYLQLQLLSLEQDKVEEKRYKLAYLQSRLASIIPKTVAEGGNGNGFFFYTSGDQQGGLFKDGSASLVFVYDNGLDLQPEFSNEVIGRLYLSPQGQLVLASWPLPKRWSKSEMPPVKKEVLLEGVSQLRFSFYNAPEVDRSKVTKNKKGIKRRFVKAEPADSWFDSWQQDYYELPAILRMDLTLTGAGEKEAEDFTMVYPLPNSQQVIYYKS